jgi:F-type H+-transporting ATPase subunit b
MPQIEQLSQIFYSQLFWLLLVFGIIYFWIGRGMVPKIQSVVEDRDRKIAGDLAAAQSAREQAEAAEEAYRERIDASRGEAMKVAQEAKTQAALDTPRSASR